MRRDRFFHVTPGFETAFDGVFHGRRVLVTGHTGFMGSWLTLWLRTLGAQVFGFALAPQGDVHHWGLLDLRIDEERGDLRDAQAVERALLRFEPEVVFHLAAQPLVRRGYREPRDTWDTNIMGLLHLYEAVRRAPSVKAVVNFTSDKCYAPVAAGQACVEADALGGLDPHAASKACAELLSTSYRASYFARDDGRGHGVGLATVRSGNVLGGGDWGEDRLVPDLVRSVTRARNMQVRNPQATRPWQHVLEPLSGALMVAQRLLQHPEQPGGAWNFGPPPESHLSVRELLDTLATRWNAVRYELDETPQPPEAQWVALDCTRARTELGWQPVWDIQTTLARTAQWYRRLHQHGEVCSADDLRCYLQAAQERQLVWAAEPAAATVA